MKIQYALPLAVAMGLGFGAVAIRGLHARTTAPPFYLVVEIDEITDASGFEALRQTADATVVEVQFEDGRYFARIENATALDGSAPKFFALIAFDNMTKAKAFNDSMKNNTALRNQSNEVEVIHRRGHIPLARVRGHNPHWQSTLSAPLFVSVDEWRESGWRLGFWIKPRAHFLTRLEVRHSFLSDRDYSTSFGVAPLAWSSEFN